LAAHGDGGSGTRSMAEKRNIMAQSLNDATLEGDSEAGSAKDMGPPYRRGYDSRRLDRVASDVVQRPAGHRAHRLPQRAHRRRIDVSRADRPDVRGIRLDLRGRRSDVRGRTAKGGGTRRDWRHLRAVASAMTKGDSLPEGAAKRQVSGRHGSGGGEAVDRSIVGVSGSE
jgi:hypothetical protein